MSNEIVKANTSIITTYDDAERAARAMAASGFFPDSKQAAQAVVKILAGQELGFGPFASMTGVAVIQGKPAIGANLMAAAVKRTGKYNYRVITLDDTTCELAFFEGGQEVGRSKFDMKDAAAANLNTKDNWRKFPRNMLFARALSNGVKWYAPDIFNGATVYTPDEMGATVDDEGNPVQAEHAEVIESKPNEAERIIKGILKYNELRKRAQAIGLNAEELPENITLDDLMDTYKDLKVFVEQAEAQAAE